MYTQKIEVLEVDLPRYLYSILLRNTFDMPAMVDWCGIMGNKVTRTIKWSGSKRSRPKRKGILDDLTLAEAGQYLGIDLLPK